MMAPLHDQGSLPPSVDTERKEQAASGQESIQEEALRSLVRQMLARQEAERREWSRRLHDELGQSLAVLKLQMQILRRERSANGSAVFDPCIEAADAALREVREMALQLRPSLLDDLGLVPALRWLVGQLRDGSALEIHSNLPETTARWPVDLETTCFRIAQEAIGNAARHAQATRIDLDLANDGGSLTLRIADDGRGFDAKAARDQAAKGGSMGLLAMEERAVAAGGSLRVVSSPGHGACVLFHFTPRGEADPPGSTP